MHRVRYLAMQVALLLVPAAQPLADCLPLEWW